MRKYAECIRGYVIAKKSDTEFFVYYTDVYNAREFGEYLHSATSAGECRKWCTHQFNRLYDMVCPQCGWAGLRCIDDRCPQECRVGTGIYTKDCQEILEIQELEVSSNA